MTQNLRGQKKTLEGRVVSDRMVKTRVVEVSWRRRHPRYEKVLIGKTRLHVHDEENKAKTGDRVMIQETRPLSAQKRWRIIQIFNTSHGTTQNNPIGR
jgi:small subunit ribosomal protein S17